MFQTEREEVKEVNLEKKEKEYSNGSKVQVIHIHHSSYVFLRRHQFS